MALKRELSLGVGLATAALVWGIYQYGLPPMADIRCGDSGDTDVAATERACAWQAAAVVAGVSLIAHDATVFVLGGAMVVGLSWWTRHSNHYNPNVGSAVTPSSRQILDPSAPSGFVPTA